MAGADKKGEGKVLESGDGTKLVVKKKRKKMSSTILTFSNLSEGIRNGGDFNKGSPRQRARLRLEGREEA